MTLEIFTNKFNYRIEKRSIFCNKCNTDLAEFFIQIYYFDQPSLTFIKSNEYYLCQKCKDNEIIDLKTLIFNELESNYINFIRLKHANNDIFAYKIITDKPCAICKEKNTLKYIYKKGNDEFIICINCLKYKLHKHL